jgi:hypothetical protein
MTTEQILEGLNDPDGLPVEAIEAARANRDAVVAAVLKEIESVVASGDMRIGANALFVAVHLLGEWRETTAYRPLASFLRLPGDTVEEILGDAISETIHKVMASVFGGDPGPLHAIILDPAADDFVRSRMFDSLSILTRSGAIPRAETFAFLRDCFKQLDPETNFVWNGWVESISRLGFMELKPLVERAFARGSIGFLTFEDFESDLKSALADPEDDDGGDLTFLDDTIAELQFWSNLDAESATEESDDWPAEDRSADSWRPDFGVPVRNPFRDVGRNDPCPCGSGKKFKKCCIDVDPDELLARIRPTN